MPRSLWNGTIVFGVVRVPVKLYTATESKTIRFQERHVSDGAAIEHRRMCAAENKEVPYSEIVKGFEVSAGRHIVLSKQEMAAADGPAAHTIEIEHFVSERDIDPIYYEQGYYLGPGGFDDEPYRLLHGALKRSDRVGIGRFVFHNKARLVAIRTFEGVMALHTMRFADEFVAPAELDMPAAVRKPSKLERNAAQALVDQLVSSFEPDVYHDTYRSSLLELIERKARGEAIEVPQSEPATTDEDLLTVLQASLEKHERRGDAPARGGSGSAKRGPASAKAKSASTKVRAPKQRRTRGGH